MFERTSIHGHTQMLTDATPEKFYNIEIIVSRPSATAT
jgi:hypothetical protein